MTMTMRRYLVPLLVLPALVVVATSAAVTTAGRPDHSRVYTVAEVRDRLARNPGDWVGRTVRVRGKAMACHIWLEHGHFQCRPQRPCLSDPDADATSEPLLLRWDDPNPALTVLRRLPLLGSLMRAPQTVDWGEVATYRIQVRPMASSRCGTGACYEALLLDAAPDVQ